MRGWLVPWRAAAAVWGPYGVRGLRQRFRQGEFGADDLDPLLRYLVPIRLWLSLGVIVWAVKVVTGPNPVDAFENAAIHGVITMILGPWGVLLGVFVLAVAARLHPSALRWLIRPTLVAVVTIIVAGVAFGLQISVVRQAMPQNLSPSTLLASLPLPLQFAAGLAGSLLSFWLGIFGVCGVYLMHRNGFSFHSHPYLRPIVATWLSLCIAAVELQIDEHPGLDPTWFLVSVLAGPLAVAALSIVELIRLKHLGLSLRRAT